jgi:hypothetical protein
MDYSNGWIAVYRSLMNHWLYPIDRPFTKLEAWIDLLMMVNWTNKTVCFGGEMIECQRGEIITSQLKLMKRWGWSKAKLLRLQTLLQKDRMIDVKSDSKKTTIRILNYEEYQCVIENSEIKKTAKKTTERPETLRKKDRKLTTTEQNNNITIEEIIDIRWKTDFSIYQKQCLDAFTKFANDPDFIAEQKRFYPRVDIDKTIWNAHRSFWGEESGWKQFKKRRTKTINWKLTIINAIKWKPNQIYLEGSLFSKPDPAIEPKIFSLKKP